MIAQNLMTAFQHAGHELTLASRYKCYSKRSDPTYLDQRKLGAIEEAHRLIAIFRALPKVSQPQVWVSYHPYCKAPDWIGPIVSQALAIPYVTIEAARTNQGNNNEWQPWRMEAQAGIRTADRHLCFKPTDRMYLSELLGHENTLYDIPAFIDTNENKPVEAAHVPSHWKNGTPRLVTVGMMRKGKKDKNFYMLAEALTAIKNQDWNLIVVGGGPEKEAIKSAFSEIPDQRIHWCGQLHTDEVASWLRAGDIFVWPGWKEPIGMVYLEAQLQKLPVVAQASMGVPLVVSHGETGLLSNEDDLPHFASNIKKLLNDAKLQRKMGSAACEKVRLEHSLEAAAKRLDECISDL